jgi:hypothetical protein
MAKLLVLSFLLLPIAIAQNDPGHDSLYILRSGDNITGNFNITGNVTAEVVQITSRIFGDNLDIRANGTIESSLSRPAIQASSNNLYLDASTNTFINSRGGTSGLIQVGDTATDNILFTVAGIGNVTQNMYVGQNLTISGSATVGGSSVCTPSNGLCTSGGSGGLWTNSTGNATYMDGNVGIGTTTPLTSLDVNGTLNVSDSSGAGMEVNSAGNVIVRLGS